ncbi:RagB/SusD family nutrient uptake outer membrane protein [Sphingobacterium sp. SGR-19]|uniref:RagB/SusD family nutrient uptake outer membrane protein n=1 Tax=Sphingobacterium sp. SGR-19 TaxID=2710886 RepID=UPI0013EABC95|nr:RagB/SusD family nutrient uptake outer membrane protein [Sphingobacterium sp. SGR-19]NGM65422.1 RagB/SusD family nutrient uptake outer membrane protein [Sphingobacterium sp. SGR-19]
MKQMLICLLASLVLGACSRNDFLNVSPNQSHIVPTTLEELQALLDRDQVMNGMGSGAARGPVPHLGEASSDDYYYLESNFSSLRPQHQNYYLWSPNPYVGDVVYDWDRVYEAIFYANVALDGLKNLTRSEINSTQFDAIMGSALFHRAHAFYQLAQIFAPPYDKVKAEATPGLPLRLESDFSERIQRVSVEDTYDRIISDLQRASGLLPELPVMKNRPSKVACNALLARVYLVMGDYGAAEKYAGTCLEEYAVLLDYNELDETLAYPFQQINFDNPEIIMVFNMQGASFYSINRTLSAKVPSGLFNLYKEHDLRKEIFFNVGANGIDFKGNYSGNTYYFAGLAIDEIYLIKAECLVRSGKVEEGMELLSTFLTKRCSEEYDYTYLQGLSEQEALEIVLEERRKQLVYRGIRWTDIRRLNQEGAMIEQRRTINGETYFLPANDARYTLPLPEKVLEFRPEWR